MSTSPFKLLCQSCGLTMQESAAALAVRLDTAKSWWLGRRTCPEGILTELKILFFNIETAAMNAASTIMAAARENGPPEHIELGATVDDHEAQSIGWPTAGAQRAVLRRVIEILPPDLAVKVKIVPRGSTTGTAAAADIHNPEPQALRRHSKFRKS